MIYFYFNKYILARENDLIGNGDSHRNDEKRKIDFDI